MKKTENEGRRAADVGREDNMKKENEGVRTWEGRVWAGLPAYGSMVAAWLWWGGKEAWRMKIISRNDVGNK